MNLLPGKLARKDAELVAEGPDVTVPVHAARFGTNLAPGKEVTIGLRPHDLVVHEPGMHRVCEIVVEVIEALGFETYVHGWARQAGPSLVVRLDPERAKQAKQGERLPLAIDPHRVHLFDVSTTLSLVVDGFAAGGTSRTPNRE
jgi:sn-glycerol 3-phosphate transport system ATP-binding protein/multiple sugar transport system ATP-binding protein